MIPLPSSCRTCVLDHELGYSELEGDGSNGLMVIAEALGKNEEKQGLPLRPNAKAGGVYQRAVDVGKLVRSESTLTNIVRCRPPNNELRGMPYERAAIDHCKQYLDHAVALRRPALLLALGDVPLRELSLSQGGISELRGYVLPSRYNIPMIATYHPSHLARGAMHLFGAFLHDIRVAHKFALNGVPEKLPTNYVLSPTDDHVRDYLDRLRSDIELPAAHDIETPGILGIKEPKDWREKKIIQVQFSSCIGEALVFDWNRNIEAIKAIYETPNMKLGWNDRLSDRPCLKANGITINGETHDLMNAWAHLQPNFVSGKDAADDEDKTIPSRLMSLQSCVSFYYPQEGPWKGVVDCSCPYEDGPERKEWFDTKVIPVLRWYGARDADMTFRVGLKIFKSLKKLGLW